ncbi:hypothetical protein [Pseudonocardia tropica]|uniref:hypothetical protein n=1 Tax=Pseudonocardia tropica TaxID=681289 RepID=UPI0031F163BA
MPDLWNRELPGGLLDDGDSPAETAARGRGGDRTRAPYLIATGEVGSSGASVGLLHVQAPAGPTASSR